MEGLLDSRHNLEQEVLFLWDDEIDKRHQTCNLQSSCKTDIQAGQASQEIHSPSAIPKTQKGQLEHIREDTATDAAPGIIKLHKSDYIPPFVVDFLKMKPILADPVKITILCVTWQWRAKTFKKEKK